MKTYKEITIAPVPAMTKKVEDKILCDICLAECEDSCISYSQNEYCFLARRNHSSWGGEGSKDTEYIDLCVGCYEKVKQLVQEKWLHVKFNKDYIDW